MTRLHLLNKLKRNRPAVCRRLLSSGVFLFAVFIFFTVTEAYSFDASFKLEIGGKGMEKGRFQNPTGIAVSDGIIYVVDSKNNRVQMFTDRGEFNDSFGSRGDGKGQFSYLLMA